MKRTLQAITASSGNLAERLFCDSKPVHESLSTYFKLPITSIQLISGRKKSDITIELEDKTVLRIQNKNGDIGGRGHSVNRSSLHKLTDHEATQTLLNTVCLRKDGERPIVSSDQSNYMLSHCFLGNLEFRPDYFTHTKMKDGQISELWICPTSDLHSAMLNDMYPEMVPKRTCVHLSPSIYLQRKGGGTSDRHPDDIQMKVRLEPYMKLFTKII
jgi:hypothetical protein